MLKNTIMELKKLLQGINRRLCLAKESVNSKAGNLKLSQRENSQRNKKSKVIRTYGTYSGEPTYILWGFKEMKDQMEHRT